jgi:hypothetical protein
MPTELQEAVVLWTARLAVALYLARLLLRARSTTRVPSRREAALWCCGCCVFLTHVAAAFQFHHDWSHAAAYVQTARQTASVTGLYWGGGLYFNYVFTAWWVADAAAVLVAARRQRPLPRRYALLTDLFFGFMVLNATVVFGSRAWLAVAAGVFVLLVALRRRSRKDSGHGANNAASTA